MNSFNPPDELDNTTQLDPRLLDKAGPIEACRRCLVSLEALLPPYPSKSAQNGRRKITFAELAWPLKESRARKLLVEISLHKLTLLLAITGDIAHDIKGIRLGVDRVEQTLTDAQRQEVYRWLEITNPSPLHNLAVQNHERETGTWLLRLPRWNEWLHWPDSMRLLWLHGIPGAGKTVLASFLIEELKDHCSYSDQDGQAYYYCHYAHSGDEAAPFLRWLVSQACRQARWVPQQLSKIHSLGCDPSSTELQDALETVLAKFQTFYVAIDAVDESSPRDDLLAVIAALAVDKRFHNLKILATSRPYFDIETKLKCISVNISMSNPEVAGDIRRMVHSRLRSSRRMKRFPHLLESIEDALVFGAQGMFRWAHCQLYNIEQLRNESQILAAIKNLPKDLAETYARALSDIPECDRAFVRRVFVWVCGHAQAPWPAVSHTRINACALLSAVSYDLGLPAGAYTLDDVKELCGCLIDVSVDSLDLFVSLAHYTVREFLQSTVFIQATPPLSRCHPPQPPSNSLRVSFVKPCSANQYLQQRTGYPTERHTASSTRSALNCTTINDRPDIQDLFLAYFSPNSPHYQRSQSMQRMLLEKDDWWTGLHLIHHLPSKVLLASTTRISRPIGWPRC
ncbi:hypothetical protein GE09DRAFT_1046277 [Coniochaeta sp. 2T2.1]|nr:hypothetical protein GE09DRAFT_1046277 [Coniochaeta sp. 2T2.1]